MPAPSDADTASIFLGRLLAEIDGYVDEFAWYQELTGAPLRPLTVQGYRKSLKDHALGELACGRWGIEPGEDTRPPY